MAELLNNLAALFKVKSIISIAIIGLVVYLGVTGALSADKVFEIALIIVGFYFGTQHEKKLVEELKEDEK